MANNKQSVNEYLYHFFHQLDGSNSKEEFLTQTLSWNQGVKNLKVDFDSDGEIDFKGNNILIFLVLCSILKKNP